MRYAGLVIGMLLYLQESVARAYIKIKYLPRTHIIIVIFAVFAIFIILYSFLLVYQTNTNKIVISINKAVTSINEVPARLNCEYYIDLNKYFLLIRFTIDDVNKLDKIIIRINSSCVANIANVGIFSESTILRTGYNELTIPRWFFNCSNPTGPLTFEFFSKRYQKVQAIFHNMTIHPYTLPKGIVVFTFDDGDPSVYTIAKPALEKHGWKGVVFIITKGTPWQFWKELYDNGWDIGSHTMTHRRLTKLSEKLLTYEINESAKVMIEHGITPFYFAYPYGDWNETVIEKVKKVYKMGFTIIPRINPYPFISPYKIYRITADGRNISEVEALVDKAEKEKGVLILLYHKITETKQPGYWSKEEFENLLEYLENKRESIEVLTISELLEKYPS